MRVTLMLMRGKPAKTPLLGGFANAVLDGGDELLGDGAADDIVLEGDLVLEVEFGFFGLRGGEGLEGDGAVAELAAFSPVCLWKRPRTSSTCG